MAKDGTNRGGARAGAGRKKKALVDKVAEGRTDNLKVLPTPADLAGETMPPIHEFMKAKQRGGKDLCAVAVYENVWNWLNEKGCAALVNPTLLQQYAMSVSRGGTTRTSVTAARGRNSATDTSRRTRSARGARQTGGTSRP